MAAGYNGSHRSPTQEAAGAVLRASGLGVRIFFSSRLRQLKDNDLRSTRRRLSERRGELLPGHNGGANYALNNTITLAGGTSRPDVLKVTALSGTAVTGCVITTPGTYSVAPPRRPVARFDLGSGSGATFDMVYANAAAISVSGPATTLTADAASGATSLTSPR